MSATKPEPSFWTHIKGQFQNPPVVTADLKGKTILILGASRGIGFEAAKHFARMNPERLVLACRSQKLGDEAASKIKALTGYTKTEVRLVDLQDIPSVKAFAEKYQEDGGRLDVFIANACILAKVGEKATSDGWEPAFKTNNFATHLVCLLFLPILLASAEKYNITPRMVIVSSGMAYWARLKKEYLEAENPTRAFGQDLPQNDKEVDDRYQDSKLLNTLFTVDLASRLTKQRIVINNVNPGYTVSNMRADWKGFKGASNRLAEMMMAHTTEQGSRQLVYGAIAGSEESMKGAFISGSTIWGPAEIVRSTKPEVVAFRKRLWDTFWAELVAVEPRVQEIAEKYFD